MSGFQCLQVRKDDRVTVVQLLDDKVQDAERIALMGEELMALSSEGSPRMVVNLDNVRFLSSAAINKFVVLDRRLEASGGDLKLSNLSPEVEEVFNITRLNAVFDIFATEEEAVGAFGQENS